MPLRIHLHCRVLETYAGALCRMLTRFPQMTTDPARVTCRACRRKYDRLPPDQQQQLLLPMPQEEPTP
jgi:hypothetical protein